MFRKIGLPLIALAGIGFSVFMIYVSSRKPPTNHVFFPPPTSPYKHYIAGEGVIESAYKNILISSTFNEVITDVYCVVGQIIKKTDPLFKLDTRLLEAQLVKALSEQKTAEIDYENQKIQFSFYEKLKDKSAVSQQAYTNALYNMKLAQQRIETAKDTVQVIKTDIERSTTRAPIDGEVLQINIRVGQYANVNPFNNTPLILFGDTNTYHLRVDIDEEDSWRVIKGAPATAFIRGNSKIFIPLEFVYAEPYIIPKASLSGADTERVDTRVLQFVYKFAKNQYPVFAGQLLDIYIQAKPNEAE
jgi:RND family efflux transporter MFP subunit